MSNHPTAETLAEAIVPPQQPSPLELSPQEQPPQTSLPLGILNVLDESVNEPTPWIIENFLAEGEQMLVFGAPKVGKSQFALQLACCLAMGEPFLGWPVPVRKKVLYLNFEMGKRSFMMRIARHVSRLLVEREKRQCEEGGFEYMGEDYPWHNSDEDLPLGEDLREQINDEIRDHLFFCGDYKSLEGDHVPKPAEPLKKNQGVNPKPDPEARQDLVVRHWQSVIKVVNPDLVIFDTLSKTHGVDESSNSEIQRVLMRIRDICQISLDATNGEGAVAEKASGDTKQEIKHLAHLIVHHARKSSNDSKKGGGKLDLDSIRGGSAIRAEADVICGIFYADRKPTATHEGTTRHLVFEARNLAPDDQPLVFAKFAFLQPRQRNPAEIEAEEEAEREAQKNADHELDQRILEIVRNAFVQTGMRGLKISTLQQKVSARLGKKNKKAKGFSSRRLNMKLEYLARRSDSQFENRIKAGKEEETAKFPHERDKGLNLFWIKDGSPWLDEEPLKTAIKEHKPYPVKKARNPKAEGGG